MKLDEPLDLQWDGDTQLIDDRHRLTLIVTYDDSTSINDFDCYGKVAWIDRGHHRDQRPEGFNGAAEKLWTSSDPFWWQPWDAKEWANLDPAEQRRERELVRDLVEYGFKLIGLRLDELVVDSLGHEHWVELATEWCGGVDSLYPELLADLLCELPDITEEVK